MAPVPSWTDDALYYLLRDIESPTVADSPDDRAQLLEASCGFGGELVRVCNGSITSEAAMKARERALAELAPSLDVFYWKVGMPGTIPVQQLRSMEEALRLVDGEPRSDCSIEYIQSLGPTAAMVDFFRWMGLLQSSTDGLWRVPPLCSRLLTLPEAA